jgi:thioredoxin-like negative regulator of GroEL
MAPVIEKVVSERDNLHLTKIDADQVHNEDVMEQFDIRSIPTLVLLDEADKVLGTLVGAVSERDLNNWIDNSTGVLGD